MLRNFKWSSEIRIKIIFQRIDDIAFELFEMRCGIGGDKIIENSTGKMIMS